MKWTQDETNSRQRLFSCNAIIPSPSSTSSSYMPAVLLGWRDADATKTMKTTTTSTKPYHYYTFCECEAKTKRIHWNICTYVYFRIPFFLFVEYCLIFRQVNNFLLWPEKKGMKWRSGSGSLFLNKLCRFLISKATFAFHQFFLASLIHFRF